MKNNPGSLNINQQHFEKTMNYFCILDSRILSIIKENKKRQRKTPNTLNKRYSYNKETKTRIMTQNHKDFAKQHTILTTYTLYLPL